VKGEGDLGFATPELLAVAVLVPLLVLGIALADRARRKVLLGRLGEAAVVQRMMASVSPGRRTLKRVLVAVGMALIVIATARPQLTGKAKRGTEGLDLVIALDVSKSMLVETSAAPGRQGPEITGKLIDALPGDRIAPMVFAGAAAHFPLTDDKAVAKQFLNDLGPADLPPGSNLAEALRVATCVLRPDVKDAWNDDCAGAGGRGHGGDPLPDEPDDESMPRTEPEVELDERAKVVLLITDSADGMAGADDAAAMAPLEEVRRAV
jgi:hypothetical protein